MSTTAVIGANHPDMPLPPALKGGKESLSPAARTEINQLAGRQPGRFLLQVLLAWAVIVAAISLAVLAKSVWVSILAIFVVATRQNVLGLLVHEQAHCLGFRSRGGDLLVNLLAAYPILVLTVEGYAQVHLSHHKYFFTDKDPDFLRKSGPDWTFPMTPGKFARILVSDLLGLNIWKLVTGKRLEDGTPVFKRPHPTPKWIRPLYFALLATLLTVTGAWGIFALYWLVPLLTVFQVIVRWGAICEHRYNMPGATIEASSPVIVQSWWEKLLLPNLNFTLHPYHHYFPGVPFSRLPKVHQIFEREELVDERRVFHGYLPYLKYLLAKA